MNLWSRPRRRSRTRIRQRSRARIRRRSRTRIREGFIIEEYIELVSKVFHSSPLLNIAKRECCHELPGDSLGYIEFNAFAKVASWNDILFVLKFKDSFTIGPSEKGVVLLIYLVDPERLWPIALAFVP